MIRFFTHLYSWTGIYFFCISYICISSAESQEGLFFWKHRRLWPPLTKQLLPDFACWNFSFLFSRQLHRACLPSSLNSSNCKMFFTTRLTVSYDALSACDFSSGRGIENLFQDNADSIFDHLSPYLTSEEKQLFSTFKNIKEMMSMADMFTQFFSSAQPSDEEPEDTINNNSPKGDLNNGKLDEPSCNENDRSTQAGTDQDSCRNRRRENPEMNLPRPCSLLSQMQTDRDFVSIRMKFH